MRNKELERIAALLAQDGEDKTDGECLGEVWQFLEDCGINPDDFRSCTCSRIIDRSLCPLCMVKDDTKALAEWEDDEEDEPAVATTTGIEFIVGTELQCRSLADYDCIFRFTVLKRTAKFVTLSYYGQELRVAIRKGSDGREFCYPLGTHSMAATLYAEPF
jgi:hypothetical protein